MINLLKNNSYVLTGPLSGFLIILIIARLSHLEADKAYFLVLALLAYSSLADGGLPYKLKFESSNKEVVETIKKIIGNLLVLSPLLSICLALMIFNSAGSHDSLGELIALLAVSGMAAFFKTIADSLRVVGMKSQHRNTVDRASSLLALMKVLFAYLLVNRLPFLHTYTIMLMLEFFALAYLLRNKFSFIFRDNLVIQFKPKLYFNPAYILANIGYITGFNIDRIVSFHILNSSSYKQLIITLSLLSMSILPNKLVENTRTFPSNTSSEAVLHKNLALIFPALGIIAFIIGLWLFNAQLDANTKIYLSALSIAWVPLTIYYNNIWATYLKEGGSMGIAKMTLWSGLISGILSISLSHFYVWIIPIGLFSYSLFNAAFAYQLHKK
ncbi:hypothetical protein AOG2_28380 [Geobacter sp. AOG2]|nr:hypothetical protein AOG2_28380 [Geobacter sp. AOG2]